MRTLRLSLAGTVVLALLGGPCGGVLAQDEADALQLVTEQMEPGVERIISDGVGHDLDETRPDNRLDTDGITVAPDGTVWLTTSNHGDDNTYPSSAFIWALGQPGGYTHEHGVPANTAIPDLVTLADGTLLAASQGGGVFRLDGDRFVPDDWFVLYKEDDYLFPEGQVVGPEGEGLPILEVPNRREASAGDYSCGRGSVEAYWGLTGPGVTCAAVWEDRSTPVEPTTYLAGTYIGQIAAAPDGSVWAVGDYDGGPGGLYRITLPPAE